MCSHRGLSLAGCPLLVLRLGGYSMSIEVFLLGLILGAAIMAALDCTSGIKKGGITYTRHGWIEAHIVRLLFFIVVSLLLSNIVTRI